MKIIAHPIFSDVKIIQPKIFKDNRGYFFESFNFSNLNFNVKQINNSKSSLGTIRGLHFQKAPYQQAKIVTCLSGIILDVFVDLRKESPTFGAVCGIILSKSNRKSILIPEGFAHGFEVLSLNAEVQYFVNNYYSPLHESGIIYNDSNLDIKWSTKYPTLSNKDLNWQTFKQYCEEN